MGQFEKAVADATTAIELEPHAGELSHPAALLTRAILLRAEAYAELTRLDEAAADLELALEASPYSETEVRQLRDEYEIADPGPSDHQLELMPGETPVLAERLVEVPGYTYVDVEREELDIYLTNIETFESDADADVIAGASWHSIVSDDPEQNTTQNTFGSEVGFLFLIQRNETIEDSDLLGQLRNAWLGGQHIGDVHLAGVSVELFENPDMPNSRYYYAWADDDVAAIFDGADRASLESWLTAYLEELTQADQ